ncbi:efflux transporter outer membrane subunit [Stakelama tenebrarum]|uniref:efflux transporter outer membrane subunit n=1 Tax=Stakelama tenebrarum TaxID=2711215 RepID=UPI001D18D77F|nr:efflux transporter outer membrane subunit [Sphingosinithalassobacter tenebrarum]
MTGRAAALCALLALSACNFAPDSPRPATALPAHYAGADGAASTAATVGWQDFFRDPALRGLIGRALAANHDIRIAAANVAQARAAWRIEGAPLYPQLDAVGSGQRGQSIFTLPGVGTQPIDVRQVSAQLSAGWEIDFWGRLRNLRDAAASRFLASEESRRAVATGIIAQVANGYLLEREYAERVALARQAIANRTDALRIMRRRHEVGAGTRLDVARARILLAQAEQALQALEQDRAINRNALALLVGGGPIDFDAEPDAVAIAPVALPTGLPSDLLVNRPDVIAAEYQLRAANADIGAARAAFFPNIRLTGAYGLISDDLDGLFSDGIEGWSFAPQITLPIFHGGQLRGNLGVAHARRDEAVARYEQTVQQAFRDVSDALVRRRQIGLQLDTARALVDAQRERARLAQLRFDNGRSSYLEVLDAERELFDAEQALVQLRRAQMASVVALYAALGGGFPADAAFEETTE